MAEPMIKGGAILEVLAWWEDTRGLEELRSLAHRLPPDFGKLVDPDQPVRGLLSSSWYPSRFVWALLDDLAARRGEAEVRRLLKEATRWAVRRGTKGVYGFLLERLGTPDLYAMAVPRLWRQLHTTGERRMKVLAPGEAESAVARWPGHHPQLCTLTIELMCAVFERMGLRDVTWERTSCVAEGGAECVTRLRWRP